LKNTFYVQGVVHPKDKLLHGAEIKMQPQPGIFKQAQKVGKQAEVEQNVLDSSKPLRLSQTR